MHPPAQLLSSSGGEVAAESAVGCRTPQHRYAAEAWPPGQASTTTGNRRSVVVGVEAHLGRRRLHRGRCGCGGGGVGGRWGWGGGRWCWGGAGGLFSGQERAEFLDGAH